MFDQVLAEHDPYRHPFRDAALIDDLTATQAEITRLEARKAGLIAALDIAAARRTLVHGTLDTVFADVHIAAALRISDHSAARQIQLARELMRLPATRARFSAGRLGAWHTRLIVDAVVGLTDAQARAVETRVLPGADELAPAQLRRRLTPEVLRADPARAEQSRLLDTEARRVVITPSGPGTAELWALIPADAAQGVWRTLSGLAHAQKGCPGETRTADQLRADTLVELLAGARVDADGSVSGLRPRVHVTVAASTLLGLDQQPGELAGHGPIPAALARSIAADESGTLRKLLTDDAGHVTGIGRHRYRPPAALRDLIVAREQTCRHVTCSRAAEDCEIDHIDNWAADDGPTDPDNLQAVCSRHHHAKHDDGWKVERQHDGTVIWTSPTGHIYIQRPETVPTTTTTPDPPEPEPPGEDPSPS